MPSRASHRWIRRAMNSGPSALRKYCGAPRRATSCARTGKTRSPGSERATVMARHSFVNSSTTVKHLNGESFFVRHAYFTGADQPYEKLQRALRAEIDEVAWRSLYSTTSRPFDPPTTGKIAIKVINHYGDEVLKVFPV